MLPDGGVVPLIRYVSWQSLSTKSKKPTTVVARPARKLEKQSGRKSRPEKALGVVETKFIIDPSLLDVDNPVADIDAIRALNPQRFEMEQLTAILYEDRERNVCAALKQVTDDEFWVRGHMPGMPLMPGVVMLEAVAQLSSYFTQRHDLLGAEMVGFGGVDGVRFRGVVTPGDKLILMVELLKARRGRMIVAAFQGVVDGNLVLEGTLRGIPIPIEAVEIHRTRQD
jgi:3-hydroxyacyl-[acyl-carrier-protein] dehydratase